MVDPFGTKEGSKQCAITAIQEAFMLYHPSFQRLSGKDERYSVDFLQKEITQAYFNHFPARYDEKLLKRVSCIIVTRHKREGELLHKTGHFPLLSTRRIHIDSIADPNTKSFYLKAQWIDQGAKGMPARGPLFTTSKIEGAARMACLAEDHVEDGENLDSLGLELIVKMPLIIKDPKKGLFYKYKDSAMASDKIHPRKRIKIAAEVDKIIQARGLDCLVVPGQICLTEPTEVIIEQELVGYNGVKESLFFPFDSMVFVKKNLHHLERAQHQLQLLSQYVELEDIAFHVQGILTFKFANLVIIPSAEGPWKIGLIDTDAFTIYRDEGKKRDFGFFPGDSAEVDAEYRFVVDEYQRYHETRPERLHLSPERERMLKESLSEDDRIVFNQVIRDLEAGKRTAEINEASDEIKAVFRGMCSTGEIYAARDYSDSWYEMFHVIY
ncbi:MAG: hypothetical protein KBC64_05795 [Simkaniaceae bacterium]|nr:hypothetical protein [Simkaniaceae bacterium]